MFLHGENEYCYSLHTTQSHLQIQYNLYQDSNGIFQKYMKNDHKICLKPQKT